MGHTLDHVLTAPALRDRVAAQVIPQDVLELSDHAAITVIVDI